ncbi:MAG: RNase adapter RapZ [Fusobacteriota bacterium]
MVNRTQEFLIITGMSGAGKTEAINYFEDRGYFCIDNLPASLLSNFIDIYTKSNGKIEKVAFVIDMRDKNFLDSFFCELKKLRENNINYKTIFLDAKNDILLNRFKETRRKHPLDKEDTLLESIKKERRELEEIKKMATLIIDTSELSRFELKEKLEQKFSDKINPHMNIVFISFGFKYGIPLDIDLLFDVRFLPNPFYKEDLRLKTGNDKEVQDYVMKFEQSQAFFDKLTNMLDFLLPQYKKEGKSYVTIGIGCTGGHHRSVTFVNKLYDFYSGKQDYYITLSHRDENK